LDRHQILFKLKIAKKLYNIMLLKKYPFNFIILNSELKILTFFPNKF